MEGILSEDDMDLPFMPPPQQAQPQAPQAQPQGMFGKFNQAITNNSDVLMAAAIGMAPNTPIGGALAGVQEHYRLQDQLKQKKDAQAAMLALKREQMENQKSIANDKLDALRTKAAQGGAPKILGRAGGQTTIMWPDRTIQSIRDEEVQKIYEAEQAAKTERAALTAGSKAQAEVTAPAAVKLEGEQDAKVRDAEKSIEAMRELRGMFEETGGISLLSRVLPNGISESGNRILGTQDGKLQAAITKLNMKNFIALVAGFPGALSNKEGDRIERALPKIDDDPSLWKHFFDTYGPTLEADYANMVKHQQAREAQKAQTMALPSYRNGGGTSKPMQKYPPGFNPPNSGLSQNPEDRTAILQAELQAEQAKPASPERDRNIQTIQRELGIKPQAQAPAAAPAARPPLSAFKLK